MRTERSNGWIKLHRKTLSSPVVMKDGEHLAVWIYLLLNATHEDYPALFKGKRITLHAGQLITGRKSISTELNISESKVRRILDDFIFDQQIDRQTSNKNSLITILNWSVYQITDQQPTNNRPTTDHKQEYKEQKNIRSIYSKQSKVHNFEERKIDFEQLEKEVRK